VSIPAFQLYLFDIDGTLLDSAADICGAARDTLEAAGATGLTDVQLRSYIGYHLKELFEDVFPGISEERSDELLRTYRAIYPLREHRSTRIYDGVPEMLSALGGLKSTATTKGSETARIVLTQFGLVDYFDHVQGTDGFPCKPEPDVILRSLQKFGVAPEQCLFIGDAAPDMEAGRRAGVKTCGVSWGYGDVAAMRKQTPDYWITNPLELTSRVDMMGIRR
jgi:HAD superfamily hydrolase (TIGR01509 family)